MARIETCFVPATSSNDGYTMYLLHAETNWEREAVTALSKRGHGVSLRQPTIVAGDTRLCEFFSTNKVAIEDMRKLMVDQAKECEKAALQPA